MNGANDAPIGKGVYRMSKLMYLAPFAAGAAIAVYFLDWKGVIGGIAVFFVLAQLRDAIGRRLNARAAFATWGSYLDPGFTGKIEYETSSERAPRLTGSGERHDHDDTADVWLLADGALLSCARGRRFEATPDGRYLAALGDQEVTLFTMYDQSGKVSHDYCEADAPAVFADLFCADAGIRAGALAAVTRRGKAMPLLPWRGLHLHEIYLPDCRDGVVRQQIAPRLTLTATLAAPVDCSMLYKPLYVMFNPVRRLAVNGFATPYFCKDLADAIASEDGVCLLVKGFIIGANFLSAGRRWYYRGRDGAWAALDDALKDLKGGHVGRLLKIRSLTATRAVFEVDLHAKGASSAYGQASTRALPFKVAIDAAAVPPTCEVQLQKFA